MSASPCTDQLITHDELRARDQASMWAAPRSSRSPFSAAPAPPGSISSGCSSISRSLNILTARQISQKCFRFYTKLNKCYIKFIWVVLEMKRSHSKTLTNPSCPVETVFFPPTAPPSSRPRSFIPSAASAHNY